MPTDEFKPLLDRSEAIRNAGQLIEFSCPLLWEVVNRACWAFHECNSEGSKIGGENEDLAVMTLFRHMIELVDGIEVLFRSSCVDATVPLLRATFEASLSLDYILQADYTQRSLSWSCAYLHARIALHRRLDPTTAGGSAFFATLGADASESARTPYDSAPSIAGLESVLRRNEFRPIEAEFQRLRRASKQNRTPEWFQLFDGPRHRRALAARVDRESEYAGLYSEWSAYSHGGDASAYVRSGELPKEAAFLAVRSAHELPHRGALAVGFLIRATRVMLEHFRGEHNLSEWYFRDVKPRWDRLRRLEIVTSER